MTELSMGQDFHNYVKNYRRVGIIPVLVGFLLKKKTINNPMKSEDLSNLHPMN